MLKLIVIASLFTLTACTNQCTQAANVGPRGTSPPVVMPTAASVASSTFEVHFSPNGGCESAYIRHIDLSKRTVHIMAYTFTSRPIAEALIRAKNRGVVVFVLADKKESSAKATVLPMLKTAGIQVLVDGSHPIFHDKVGVFDSAIVGNGSFNLGASAEHLNSENCLFTESSSLALAFENHWSIHIEHSTPIL